MQTRDWAPAPPVPSAVRGGQSKPLGCGWGRSRSAGYGRAWQAAAQEADGSGERAGAPWICRAVVLPWEGSWPMHPSSQAVLKALLYLQTTSRRNLQRLSLCCEVFAQRCKPWGCWVRGRQRGEPQSAAPCSCLKQPPAPRVPPPVPVLCQPHHTPKRPYCCPGNPIPTKLLQGRIQ